MPTPPTNERASRWREAELYVLITEALCNGPWKSVAEAALAGGARILQLREKTLDRAELIDRGRTLRTLCTSHDALLIINDDPHVAVACDADGVHVGQDDLPIPEVRAIVGPDRLIGISTHNIQQARAALEHGPDHVAVGPMFPTATKPQDHIAGPITLDSVRAMTRLPIVAIGGINPQNASLLQSADTLAVCGAVISSDDPGAAATALLDARGTAV